MSVERKITYIDIESIGFYGMPVLLQYAVEEGPIILYEIWKEPVSKTLELIESFLENILVFFNTTFDFFMLSKLHSIWSLLPGDWIPEDHVDQIANKEAEGRDGGCIKPWSTLDLMLHARRGKLQSLMARSEIRIKKIPIVLAQPLANRLEDTIQIDDIYFAKRADIHAPKWKVLDIVSNTGTVNKDYKDVCLKFSAAGGLKFLAEYVLKLKPKFHMSDVGLPKEDLPYELGFAPYATAISSAPDWTYLLRKKGQQKEDKLVKTWPALIKKHIEHWHSDVNAREYAYDDIVYTRGLYHYFGDPAHGDNDSVLAVMVAAIRWRGFMYDRDGLESLREASRKVAAQAPINVSSWREVYRYLAATMDIVEVDVIKDTTQKSVLEKIAEWYTEESEICIKCFGTGTDEDVTCERCEGTGEIKEGVHPAASRAKQLNAVKVAVKEIELYDKLLIADRFHASFKIIGTLSSRMSGADGLNAQGIKKDKTVRKQFPLARQDEILCGGDFDGFEITIADAVFDDENLHETLLGGQKFHGVLGVELFPGKTYEEILASDGQEVDFYSKAKQGTFGFLYGGDENTWHNNLSIPLKQAKKAFDDFCTKYPGIGESRDKIKEDFCSMVQPGGIGTAVIWKDPKDYCETFLGFKRYFTLENKICKELFNLAQNTPQEWKDYVVKVIRRDREQTAAGAVSSALYGAAFQMQAKNMRAANNHLIQSPGAEITKEVQRKIWDIQPHGAHPVVVAPMNIHDEIMCATNPDYANVVAEAVKESVESFRSHVPLIGMSWNLEMNNWAEKKGTSKQVHITYER